MADDKYFHPAAESTGGSDNAMDNIDGSILGDGDVCFVVDQTNGWISVYVLDDDSAAAESGESIISPDDSAGDKRWILIKKFAAGSIECDPAGAVKLNHDGTTFVETSTSVGSGGIIVTDGTDEGRIYIDGSSNVVLRSMTNGKAVMLYADDAGGTGRKRLETSAYGVTVSDAVKADNIPYSPLSYGAAADGSTDDAAEINSAISAISSAGGGILDGNGLTYRVDSTITLASNVTVKNMVIDFSNAATSDVLFELTGTADTERATLADITAGDNSTTVTDAGSYFSANDWVIVADTDAWGTDAVMGEWMLIKSISGTTITFADEFNYSYTTASTCKVRPYTFKENVHLENIIATGAGASESQIFSVFDYYKNCSVKNCKIIDFETRGARFDTGVYFNCSDNYILRSNASGIGYGVSITNSRFGNVTKNLMEYCRHGVSIGGSGATDIASRNILVGSNHVIGATDAGLDTHSPAEHITITDNHVQAGEADASGDGIYSAGRNITITDNIIENTTNCGIRVINETTNTEGNIGYLIDSNRIDDVQDSGILVTQVNGTNIDQVIVSNNVINSPDEHGISIHAQNDNIDGLVINGNTIRNVTEATFNAVYIDADTGYSIEKFSITGNVLLRGDDLDNNIELVGADATSVQIGSITGNTLNNGANGIDGTNTDYLCIVGNVIVGVTGSAVSVAGSNNVTASNAT